MFLCCSLVNKTRFWRKSEHGVEAGKRLQQYGQSIGSFMCVVVAKHRLIGIGMGVYFLIMWESRALIWSAHDRLKYRIRKI